MQNQRLFCILGFTENFCENHRLVFIGNEMARDVDRTPVSTSNKTGDKSPKTAEEIVQKALEKFHEYNSPEARIKALAELYVRIRKATQPYLGSKPWEGRRDMADKYTSLITTSDNFATADVFEDGVHDLLMTAMVATALHPKINWYNGHDSIAGRNWDLPEWGDIFKRTETEAKESLTRAPESDELSADVEKADEKTPKKFLDVLEKRYEGVKFTHWNETKEWGKVYDNSSVILTALDAVGIDKLKKASPLILGNTTDTPFIGYVETASKPPLKVIGINAIETNPAVIKQQIEDGLAAKEKDASSREIAAAGTEPIVVTAKLPSHEAKAERPPAAKWAITEKYIGDGEGKIPRTVLTTILQKEGGLTGDTDKATPEAKVAASIAVQRKLPMNELGPTGIDGIIGKFSIAALKKHKDFQKYFNPAPAAPADTPRVETTLPPVETAQLQQVLAETSKPLVTISLPKALPRLPEFSADRFYKFGEEIVYQVRKVSEEVVRVAHADGTEFEIGLDRLTLLQDREEHKLYIAERYKRFKKETGAGHLPQISPEQIFMYKGTPVQMTSWTPEGVIYVTYADGTQDKISAPIKDGTPDLKRAKEADQSTYIISRYTRAEADRYLEDTALVKKAADGKSLEAGRALFDNIQKQGQIGQLEKDTEMKFISPETGRTISYNIDAAKQKKDSSVAVLGVTSDGALYRVVTADGLVGYVEKQDLAEQKSAPPALPAGTMYASREGSGGGGGSNRQTLAP